MLQSLLGLTTCPRLTTSTSPCSRLDIQTAHQSAVPFQHPSLPPRPFSENTFHSASLTEHFLNYPGSLKSSGNEDPSIHFHLYSLLDYVTFSLFLFSHLLHFPYGLPKSKDDALHFLVYLGMPHSDRCCKTFGDWMAWVQIESPLQLCLAHQSGSFSDEILGGPVQCNRFSSWKLQY